MASIIADSLRIVRGKNEVLHSISCTITEGTLTGLVGPSGSGKTTFMRAVVGVQQINSGSLGVLGKPAGSADLRHRIGYVTQAPSIYGDLTIAQNLAYFAEVIEAPKTDILRVLEAVQLVPQQHQLVDSLSGGQRARANLAVALLGDPKLLVLDEPTVGLDPILRDELWKLFATLAKEGKTLLISSHVMDEAERCDQLVLMRDGEVVWNDSKIALLSATNSHDVGTAFVSIIKGKTS